MTPIFGDFCESSDLRKLRLQVAKELKLGYSVQASTAEEMLDYIKDLEILTDNAYKLLDNKDLSIEDIQRAASYLDISTIYDN